MEQNYQPDFKSSKKLSPDKTATNHWLYQRITALILIPLSIWGMFFIRCCLVKDLNDMLFFIKKPYNLALLLIFICIAYYHAALGMQVIVEDYVKNIFLRSLLILLIKIFSLLTVIILAIAFFRL